MDPLLLAIIASVLLILCGLIIDKASFRVTELVDFKYSSQYKYWNTRRWIGILGVFVVVILWIIFSIIL